MKKHCRLSAAEMEEEIEGCPQPWNCLLRCYEAYIGCAEKVWRGDENQ